MYEGLASGSGLLASLEQVSVQYPHLQFADPVALAWYYPLDVTRTLAFQATDILNGLQTLQVEAPGVANRPPQLQGVSLQGSADLITQYSQYTQTMQLPMTILTLQVAALLIFFVGLLLGYGLARLAVPHLIFTDAGNGNNSLAFFLAQSVPAPAIVIPGSLIISLAIFLTLCLLTLAAMIYLASRPSIGQTLRLNQD